MTVDFFPARPHLGPVVVMIACLAAVALATLRALREARRARRIERASDARLAVLVEIERERLEHRLALAQASRQLASAQALTAEIETLPAPVEALQ